MKIFKPDDNAANPLDQAFREGLANVEVPPLHGAWENIEARLDAAQPVVAIAGANWWYPSVAMLLLFALLVNAVVLIETGFFDHENDFRYADQSTPFHLEAPNPENNRKSRLPVLMGFSPVKFPFGINAFPLSNLKDEKEIVDRLKEYNIPTVDEFMLAGLSAFYPPESDISNVAAIGRKSGNKTDGLNEALFSREKETEVAPIFTSTSNNFVLTSISADDDTFRDRFAGKKAARVLQNKLIPIKGFSIGPTFSGNNNWMILKSNSYDQTLGEDIHYRMDFGTAYGIAFGYDFSTRFGIQVDYIINSNQGQKYSALMKENKVNGEIDLKYTQVPILLKYKWAKLSSKTRKPMVINYIFGLHYSHLKSAVISAGGKTLAAQNKFSNNEMGITFGFDYDLFMTKNLFFSIGTRGTLSSDIKSFPLLINDENQNPYTFLLGFNASLKYLLHKS